MAAYQEKENSRNIQALKFGALLIVLVAAVFFVRNYYLKDEPVLEKKISEEKTRENFPSISPQELIKETRKNRNLSIIDIREKVSFEAEHILDSLNFPGKEILSGRVVLDKEKKHYLIDDLGLTPLEIEVMRFLEKEGYDFSYLQGGFGAWKENAGEMVGFGNPYQFSDQGKVSYLKLEELEKSLKEEKIFLVDLRSPAEFKAGRILNSVNIPLEELEKRRKEIPLSQKTVLYGSTNVQSFQGSTRLFDMGYLNTYALSEGFSAWKERGL